MNIVSKLASAARLASSVQKWPEFWKRAGENIRQIRLDIHGQSPYFYWHKNGFPFVVLNEGVETRAIYIRGQSYEKTEAAIMNAWLTTDDHALDCGANVGLFTALMANKVGRNGKVISIEASPTTFHLLSLIKQALGLHNVETIEICLSDKGGEAYFSDDPSFSEANSMVEDGHGGVRVHTTSIDLILEKLAGKPALVKLDIEGAEPLAFKGWKTLFNCHSPPLIVFEVYPRGLKRLGFTPADIFSSMPISRFDFWHINFSWPNPAPEYQVGVPYLLADPYKYAWPTHTNVLAIPKDGEFSERRINLEKILR